jgi:putative ABC transport system permease protein
MNFTQSIVIALEMLRQHKMRAFLTMLGVIIGVMSVTMIVMISGGFQSYLNSQFNKAGADTLYLFFDPGRRMRGETTGGKDRLTTDDLAYVTQRVTSISMASGVMQVPGQKVKYGDQEYGSPQVMASDENFKDLNSFDLTGGRSLTKADVDQAANVALIGEDVQTQLFGNKSAIGKLVSMNGIAMEVIGVVKKASFLGDSTGRMVLVPITTAQKKWVGGNRLDFILLRTKPGVKSDAAMDAVWQAMMIRSGNRAIYRVDSNESIAQTFNGVIGVAGGILAAIAALSLLVGGIGIMNIMLVSVTERTQEIGLRKAIGARRSAILQQFLIEAACLSLVGGLIGMFIAWSLGNIVTLFTISKAWPNEQGLALPFPITAGIASAAFSAFIGVVFGLYPAISASKLDPIIALRHE